MKQKLCWHMIGAIQRRRIRALSEIVDCWQTVSRDEEIASIARYAPGCPIFLQVDTTRLANRNGAPIERVPELLSVARAAGLEVRGLMTVGPGPQAEPSATAAAFEDVARLADRLGLDELSMGMTEDLEAAVAAGTTMLRVGRALFGPRASAGGH
jgi:PLP dependent protein